MFPRATMRGMRTIAYAQTMDRTGWDDGPWMTEPDKLQWEDLVTGLPCLAVRGPMGCWCGYVAVFPNHPWYRCPYNAELGGKDSDGWEHTIDGAISVHGGLTFSDFCMELEEPGDEARRVCHVPGPGEPDRVWWFGFDCGHSMDISPGFDARTRQLFKHEPIRVLFPMNDTYRDLAYVQREVASLAWQLYALSPRELPQELRRDRQLA